jgi:hypothetical protein
VVDLLEIHVIIEEDELKVAPPGKPKNNYDVLHKC